MVFKYLSLLPLALGATIPRSADSPVSYEGYKALRIKNNGELSEIYDKLSQLGSYDFWGHAADHIDIALPGFELEHLKELALEFSEMHADLGKDIDLEKIWEKYIGTKKSGELPDDAWFDSYHPYDDHVEFWDDLAAAFPKNTEYFVTGQSEEGRDIFGYKFFSDEKPPAGANSTKEAVIWHGTVHAREWIAPATVEYLAWNLIDGFNSKDSDFWNDILAQYGMNRFLDRGWRNETDKSLADTSPDIYIIPFVNPDGFIYSQEVDRLWRKNRSPPPADAANQTCFGVDINRNWPFQWGGAEGGASSNPCTQTFAGTSGGSTAENTAVRNHMSNVTATQDLILYIDFHSYSQLLISPYGYTCDEVPPTNDEIVGLADKFAAAVEAVYGTEYVTGPGCQTLYQVSGGSRDYAYAVQGAQYSYTMELRDQGEFGFVLPPDQIRPNCEEVLAGMEVMLKEM